MQRAMASALQRLIDVLDVRLEITDAANASYLPHEMDGRGRVPQMVPPSAYQHPASPVLANRKLQSKPRQDVALSGPRGYPTNQGFAANLAPMSLFESNF